MDDIKNHYRENSFSLSQSFRYTLLIQFELKTFSYAVVYNNRLMAFGENCPFYQMNDFGEIKDIVCATYQNTIVGLPATALMLVPKNILVSEEVVAFARFLDVQSNEKVLAQPIDNQNIIIYKTEEVIVALAERFGIENAVYTAKGWIKAIAQNSPVTNMLYLHLNNETLQFLYFSLGKLRFYNTFEAIDEDDLAYFSVLVAEQLNLNPRITTLVISGDLNDYDNKYIGLSEFFSKVELNNISLLELPWHIPPHKILAHAALLLCASSEVH